MQNQDDSTFAETERLDALEKKTNKIIRRLLLVIPIGICALATYIWFNLSAQKTTTGEYWLPANVEVSTSLEDWNKKLSSFKNFAYVPFGTYVATAGKEKQFAAFTINQAKYGSIHDNTVVYTIDDDEISLPTSTKAVSFKYLGGGKIEVYLERKWLDLIQYPIFLFGGICGGLSYVVAFLVCEHIVGVFFIRMSLRASDSMSKQLATQTNLPASTI